MATTVLNARSIITRAVSRDLCIEAEPEDIETAGLAGALFCANALRAMSALRLSDSGRSSYLAIYPPHISDDYPQSNTVYYSVDSLPQTPLNAMCRIVKHLNNENHYMQVIIFRLPLDVVSSR